LWKVSNDAYRIVSTKEHVKLATAQIGFSDFYMGHIFRYDNYHTKLLQCAFFSVKHAQQKAKYVWEFPGLSFSL